MNNQNFSNEVWKSVQFEGLKKGEQYEVSNYGRIRHFKKDQKIWKVHPTAKSNGYEYFTWFKSEKGWKHKISKPIHRLVAESFCARQSDNQKFVIHIDYNKGNNFFKNLKWVTQEEVSKHTQGSPLTKLAIERNRGNATNAKLTEADVIRLKKKLKRGKNKLYKLAREFGITHTQLNRIRSGENWGHVKVD